MSETTAVIRVAPAAGGEGPVTRQLRLPVPAGQTLPGEPSSPPPSRECRVFGRFQVERELGRGGMGVMLLARDRDLGRPVALKFLQINDPDAVARLRLEATALANLSHPNAVRVFEIGDDAGRPFLALEFVDGPSLHEALRDGPLEPRTAAGLIRAVASAVHAAHTAGVLHRDLKPANVLLDPDGTPKLTDFGLAKRLDAPSGLTATNQAVGTPNYMPPEQAQGQAADARTDVYGLGATLYECLTGRPPFTGPAAAVLCQVLADDPVSPRRLNPAVPRDLETVCLKCLEKDPNRRYATADELVADLDRFLGGRSITARPAGLSGRAVKWGRRNKAVAAATLAAVLSLVGGATAAGVQAVRATRARDAEAAQRQVAEDKAAEVVAMNQFLLDDLLRQADSHAQADAQHIPDPNLTVRTALTRAAAKLGGRFADRPATAEAVRLALGDALRGVGDYGPAADQFRLAANSRADRLGADHPDTRLARGRQASALVLAGRPADAVPLLEDALRAARERDGPAYPGTLRLANDLGMAYRHVGRAAEAVAVLEDARAAGAGLPPGHLVALTTPNLLAMAYSDAGRPVDALPLAREAWELARDHLGPDHPETLIALNNFAVALQEVDRPTEAVGRHEECLRLRRGRLGPDHPDTLASLSNLATAYEEVGRPADAEPLYRDCLRLRQGRLGPDHPTTLITQSNLAGNLIRTGRAAAAVPLLEDGLLRLRGACGPAHPRTLEWLNTLGVAYQSVGRHADAERMHREALSLRRQHLGANHPDTLNTMHSLGVCLVESGRPAEAVPVLEEALRGRQAKLGPTHLDTLNTLSCLARAFFVACRFAEAAAQYEASWQGWMARDPGHPKMSEVRGGLGISLLQAGRFAEAEPHLLAREADLAASGPADLRAKARRVLAELYDKWGKPAEAAKWRVELAPRPRPAD